MKESETLLSHVKYPPAKTARMLAFRWLEGAKVGLLQPLEPVAYEDSSRDGVKNEIVNANINVAEALNNVSDEERGNGQWNAAAKDAMLAASTLEVTKFFDFASLAVCSMVQRRSLSIVASELPQLSLEVKTQVTREALALRASDDQLGQMALKARTDLLQYELRRGYDVRRVAATQKQISVGQFREPLPMLVKSLKTEMVAAKDLLSPELFTDMRLGYLSALETDRKVDGLVKASTTVL